MSSIFIHEIGTLDLYCKQDGGKGIKDRIIWTWSEWGVERELMEMENGWMGLGWQVHGSLNTWMILTSTSIIYIYDYIVLQGILVGVNRVHLFIHFHTNLEHAHILVWRYWVVTGLQHPLLSLHTLPTFYNFKNVVFIYLH